jgi:hypothetical protein
LVSLEAVTSTCDDKGKEEGTWCRFLNSEGCPNGKQR